VYDLAEIVPLTYAVVDAAGAPANAAVITLTIGLPDGTTATPTITNPPVITGTYVHSFVPTLSGRHTIRWATTGPTTSGRDVFDVWPDTSSALVSLADVKAHLNKTSTGALGTVDDEELRLWIESATAEIEATCGAVAPRTVVETVTARGGRLWLGTTPVLSVTSATLGGVAQDTSGWTVSRLSGIVTASSGYLSGDYTVTSLAGRSPIPAPLIGSALLRVQHSWETQRGPAELPLAEAAEGGGSAFLLLLRARDKEAPYHLPVVA
jgi:hypothetical protein